MDRKEATTTHGSIPKALFNSIENQHRRIFLCILKVNYTSFIDFKEQNMGKVSQLCGQQGILTTVIIISGGSASSSTEYIQGKIYSETFIFHIYICKKIRPMQICVL